MATKSFLSSAEISEALEKFTLSPWISEGKDTSSKGNFGSPLAAWLSERLLHKLSAIPHWYDCEPIQLGSWARGELCPKSDIDMIFLGPEELVKEFVGEAFRRGLKLRARVPESLTDWTKGVAAFDVLAILGAKAVNPTSHEALLKQQTMIQERGLTFAKDLLKAILKEKQERTQRFDSVANYLEPNIKFGSGGLRDIEQALAIRQLFQKKFSASDAAWAVFEKYKQRWLELRRWLHLRGGGDILTGPDQFDLAPLVSFASPADFNREFQQGVSAVSFYADWVIAQAGKTRKKNRRELKTVNDALIFLESDNSVLAQAEVRARLSELKLSVDWAKFYHIKQNENWFAALFDSHLLDLCVPSLKRLRGYVQHDHYHRYAADAHLAQTVREVVRVYKRPLRLGKLGKWSKVFRSHDWEILLWTALYHDLAKGQGGDHSRKGAHLVAHDLKAFGLSATTITEVQWMVEHHLLLSEAAFRRNPKEPKTWAVLHEAGGVGERLARLAVFTAIDICATNPDAWNDWKQRLLVDLLETMASRSAAGIIGLLDEAQGVLANDLIEDIDPVVASSIPKQKLLNDLKQARRSRKKDLPPYVLKNRQSEIWVRFHSHEDRPGLFLEFVSKLYALGCSIQHSVARTSAHLGVYDWFHVKTTKPPAQLAKQLLSLSSSAAPSVPAIALQQVEVIDQGNDGMVVSFRGRNQKGLLLAAAQSLYDLGLAIRWAKVMTWGAQIDDVFAVVGPVSATDLETLLTQKFVPELSKATLAKK